MKLIREKRKSFYQNELDASIVEDLLSADSV